MSRALATGRAVPPSIVPCPKFPVTPPPALLASVRSLAEAEQAWDNGAQLVDLKDPEQEPLGAVSPELAFEAVQQLGDQVFLSAAAGLLQEQGGSSTALSLADAGVDVVKLGVPPGRESILSCLNVPLPLSCRLVVVFFAEHPPAPGWLRTLRDAGAWGVMLDTLGKGRRGLRQLLGERALSDFLDRCRELGLRTGLAGSLRADDIEALVKLDPDYLGFRGALCTGGLRTARLDPSRVRKLRTCLQTPHSHTGSAGGGPL